MNLLPSREYLEALRENRAVLGEYSSEIVEAQQVLGKYLLDLARQGVAKVPLFKSEYAFGLDDGEVTGFLYCGANIWDELKSLLVSQGYSIEDESKDYYRLKF